MPARLWNTSVSKNPESKTPPPPRPPARPASKYWDAAPAPAACTEPLAKAPSRSGARPPSGLAGLPPRPSRAPPPPPAAAAPPARKVPAKSRSGLYLALAVLAAAGGGAAWWFTRPPATPPADPRAPLEALFASRRPHSGCLYDQPPHDRRARRGRRCPAGYRHPQKAEGPPGRRGHGQRARQSHRSHPPGPRRCHHHPALQARHRTASQNRQQ